uniref:Peptidase S1 domain-containing protein n=1 Tax=Romanomermis culicivorax TaxID=13658 RepID=A0A915HVT9_ROMCU
MELSRGHRYERIPKSDRSEFTEPHSKPWMAVLLSKLDNDREDYAPCGAALISRTPYTFEKVENGSSEILITAAHCVVSRGYVNSPQRVFVLFGKHDTSKYENSEIRIGVKSIMYKEGYKIYNTTYDIAMLKLVKPVVFNKYIKPIPLSKSMITNVHSCSVSGWGISDRHTIG